MEWPNPPHGLAKAGSPFFCQLVELISRSGFAKNGLISISQKVNGEIVIRTHDIDESEFEMPNWPYHTGTPDPYFVVTGGGCPGAPTH